MSTKYVATFEVETDKAVAGLDAAAQSLENTGDATEQLQLRISELQAQMSTVDVNSAEYAKLKTELDSAGDALKQLGGETTETVGKQKTMKQELREVTAQLAAMTAAGDETSAEFQALQKRAGQLKDAMGDTAAMIKTNAGGAFENVASSAGLFKDRLMSMDFEGLGAAATNFGTQLNNIKPADLAKGIGSIGQAFLNIGKALLTNPIFLIAAAIVAAVMAAKEFTSAIDGISRADENNLKTLQAKATASKTQLDNLNSQDNVLKMQGKSEREILEIKIKAAGQAIQDQRAVLETLKIQKKQQLETVQRNYDFTKGIIQFLTIPLQLILGAVDGILTGLNAVGVLSDETFASIGSLREGMNDSLTSMLFDPKEVKEEGDKSIAEAEKVLMGLENQQAGYQLSVQAMDKKAADDRKKANDDKAKANAEANAKLLEQQRKVNEELAKIEEERNQKGMSEKDKELRQAELKFKALYDQAVAAKMDTSAIEDAFDKEVEDIHKKYDAQELAREREQNRQIQALKEERLAIEEQLLEEIDQMRLTDAEKQARAIRDQYFEKANTFKEGSDEYNALIAEGERQVTKIMDAANKERLDNQKAADDKLKAAATAKFNAIVDTVGSVIQALTDINEVYMERTQRTIDGIDKQLESVSNMSQEQVDIINAAAEEQLAQAEQLQGAAGAKEKARIEAETRTKLKALEKETAAKNKALLAQRAAAEADAKKQFERNKKLQIAAAMVQTIAGGIAAFTQTTMVAGPIIGAIAAAAAVASGIAAIAKIQAQQYEGAEPAGGEVDYGSAASASQNEPPQYNPFRNRNALDRPEQGMPTRAYVVSTDMQTSIAMNEKLRDLSRL